MTLTILPKKKQKQTKLFTKGTTRPIWTRLVVGISVGGGLRNNVGLGFKPVYYTDGAADFKALSRHLGKLFKASVNI